VQASQKLKLENISQNLARGASLKDLTAAMSKLLDIKLKDLTSKPGVEGLKQALKTILGIFCCRSNRQHPAQRRGFKPSPKN